MKIRVVRDGVGTLEDDWFSLAETVESAGLTQYPQYGLACWHAFDAVREASMIVLILREDKIVGVFPVQLRKRRLYGISINVLEFLDFPTPVRDVLIDAEVSADDVMDCLTSDLSQALGKRWDFMSFRGVLESSVLVGLTERRRFAEKKHVDISHRLNVQEEGYVTRKLKSKVRSNLRRNLKKLGTRGDYRFETIDSFPALEDAYQAFLKTEAAGWKSVSGGKRAIALHADQTTFYRRLLEKSSEHGRSHIHLLYLDDEPIASDLCIMTSDACYSLKHGYDERYADVAPGNLLREYAVEYYGRHDEIDYIDLISGMNWHLAWQPERRKVYEARFYNRTARGLALFQLSKLRSRSNTHADQVA